MVSTPVQLRRASRRVKIQARHQMFANLLATGASQLDSYRVAGFAADGKYAKRDAERLAADPGIKELKEKALAQARVRLNISVDTLILELEEARQRAIVQEKPADEIRAIEAKAKVLGYLRDKADVAISIIAKPALTPDAPIELSIEEWKREWAPKSLPAPGAVNGKNGNGHA